MKNTKKIITLALAAAMLSATGITAFAADPETKATNVSYDVQPTYTVSIPAAVTLSDADVTADITASDVILEDGKQIKVDLTAASNTASGSTFNAKNGDSTVTYTITGDKAIAVGDTVATFTANGSKTLTFSAADKSAATVAGTHTETLTFTVSLADAAQTIDPETIIAQAGVSTYTGDNVKITVTSPGASSNPFYLSYYNGAPKHTATIEALNGAKIDKIEVTQGFYDISTLVAEKGDISITGTVATVSNINDTSVVIGSTNRLEVSQVKVYFK